MISTTVLDDLRDLEPWWERLVDDAHRSEETRPGVFVATIEHSPAVVSPLVVAAESGPDALTMLFGRVERRSMSIVVGFREVFRFDARVLVVVQDGVIGSCAPGHIHELVQVVTDLAVDDRVDVVQFLGVRPGTELEDAISAVRRVFRASGSTVVVRTLRTDTDFELVCRGKVAKDRRAAINQFARLGDRLRLVRFGPDSDPARMGDLLDEVSRRAYGRALGFGYAPDPLHRSFARVGLPGGWYCGLAALVDDRPVAFWTWFRSGRLLTLHETAFDPALKEFAPGSGLLAEVVRSACEDEDTTSVSFGRGDAFYKRVWSDEEREIRDFECFARRPKWLLFLILQRTVAMAVAGGQRLLGGERVARLRRWLIARRAGSS